MLSSKKTKLKVQLENHSAGAGYTDVWDSLYKEDILPVEDEEVAPRVKVVLFGSQTHWPELLDRVRELRTMEYHTIAIGMHREPVADSYVWSLLENGAEEAFFWHQVLQPAAAIAARVRRWQLIEQVLQSPRVEKFLIGHSSCWRRLLGEVVEIACFSNAPVLLMGESGTGKELIARLIHDLDRRAGKKELILVDCASVVPELSGSEFFGHEKGAFTNAVSARDGAFALADEGSLFLDEVGELPLNLQSELLRAIQEGSYKRVGSNTWKFTDFRLISATNRNLPEDVKQGRFREDLYYRISTCVCWVPPLYERQSDIPELARHFLRLALGGEALPSIDKPVLHYLINRNYPGNVRELRQLMIRIAYRHSGEGPVTVGDIPEADRPCARAWREGWDSPELERLLRLAMANGVGMKEIKRLVSNKAMELAIEEAGGNLQAAAQRLQVSDRTLQSYQAARKNGLQVNNE